MRILEDEKNRLRRDRGRDQIEKSVERLAASLRRAGIGRPVTLAGWNCEKFGKERCDLRAVAYSRVERRFELVELSGRWVIGCNACGGNEFGPERMKRAVRMVTGALIRQRRMRLVYDLF